MQYTEVVYDVGLMSSAFCCIQVLCFICDFFSLHVQYVHIVVNRFYIFVLFVHPKAFMIYMSFR